MTVRPRAASADGAALGWAVAGLALAAWLALWLWGASPYAEYLGHHRAPGGPGGGLAAALFAAGWTLMTIAMMLPTSARLLRGCGRLVRHRRGGAWVITLVAAGFVGAWLITGYAFRQAGSVLHALAGGVDWLRDEPWIVGGATLALAGMYQFTPLKARCLTACRSPDSFIHRHWRGDRPAGDALRIGFAYGWSCVGCCWALMLVMFLVGVSSVAWMLALAALMAVEKNTVAGRRLRVPIGLALVAAAVAVAVLGVDGSGRAPAGHGHHQSAGG